jgi:hypothetical protein
VVELGGHQREVAGGLEQLIEAGCQLVSGGVVEVEATADTAAKRQQLGSAQPVVQTAVAGEDVTAGYAGHQRRRREGPLGRDDEGGDGPRSLRARRHTGPDSGG